MSIETTEDWNERMSCFACCEMHECISPIAASETAIHNTNHDPVAFDSGTYYIRRLLHYAPGGTLDEFMDENFETSLAVNNFNSITTPVVAAIPTSIDYFGAHTPEESREAGIAYLLSNFSWADPNPRGGSCGATISSTESSSFGNLKAVTVYFARAASSCGWRMANLTFSRFRWRVPINTSNSPDKRYKYYKVTWDIVFFPETGSPVVESTDNTWENSLDSEDLEDAGFYSPYYELTPKDEEGELRVVNVRFSCYHSTRYGTKPNITGEAYP